MIGLQSQFRRRGRACMFQMESQLHNEPRIAIAQYNRLWLTLRLRQGNCPNAGIFLIETQASHCRCLSPPDRRGRKDIRRRGLKVFSSTLSIPFDCVQVATTCNWLCPGLTTSCCSRPSMIASIHEPEALSDRATLRRRSGTGRPRFLSHKQAWDAISHMVWLPTLQTQAQA